MTTTSPAPKEAFKFFADPYVVTIDPTENDPSCPRGVFSVSAETLASSVNGEKKVLKRDAMGFLFHNRGDKNKFGWMLQLADGSFRVSCTDPSDSDQDCTSAVLSLLEEWAKEFSLPTPSLPTP